MVMPELGADAVPYRGAFVHRKKENVFRIYVPRTVAKSGHAHDKDYKIGAGAKSKFVEVLSKLDVIVK